MSELNRLTLRPYIAIFVAAVVLLASCANSTTPPPSGPLTLKNVPAKIAVDIPKSLNPATTAGKSFLASRALLPSFGTSRATTTSAAYAQIKQNISMMNTTTALNMLVLIMVDGAIDGVAPSSTQHAAKDVTVTQAMIDTFNASVPASVREALAAQGVAFTAGESRPLSSFVYDTVTNTSALPYDYMFETTDTSAVQGGTDTYTTDIYWDTARKSVLYKQVSTGVNNYTTLMSYDDTNKLSAIMSDLTDSSGNPSSFSVKIKQQTDAASLAKHGVYVFFQSSNTDAYGAMSFSAEGVADDSGGYLNETSFGTYNNVVHKDRIEESFDGSGNQTGYTYSHNGKTHTSGGTLDATYAGEYTSEATAIDAAQTEANTSGQTTADSLDKGTTSFQVIGADTTIYKAGNLFLVYDKATDTPSTANFSNVAGSAYCEADGTIDLSFQKGHTAGTTVYLYLFTPPADSNSTGTIDSNKNILTLK